MKKTKSPIEEADFKELERLAVEEHVLKSSDDQLKREQNGDQDNANKHIWLAVKVISLLLCLGILIYQIPQLYSLAQQGKKSARSGSYSTDANTDQCIHNLWAISGQLQLGQHYENIPVCPLSDAPYIISSEGDLTTARCPNPDSHGFSAIQTSNVYPIPELIK